MNAETEIKKAALQAAEDRLAIAHLRTVGAQRALDAVQANLDEARALADLAFAKRNQLQEAEAQEEASVGIAARELQEMTST